ncbi:MAG: hypothetical protein JEZ00_16830 [Anaerolineaceae bacterium]|nr:hypothetical protein [Anaerolineaceae bacterium]
MKPKRFWFYLLFAILLAACTPEGKISGLIVDENGNVLQDAVVRIKGTNNSTISDQQGAFTLSGVERGKAVFVTAWVKGYFINGINGLIAGDKGIIIELHAHSMIDNPAYQWMMSTAQQGIGEDQGCAACHSSENGEIDFALPVDEWLLDAHAQSAINMRFLSMYNGTDLDGNQSPLTRYGYTRDYGSFPLRPDRELAYNGPGYKLDFPDSAGNCATCHTPLSALDQPYAVDPNQLSGVELEGINCDFCHKVWDVTLDPQTQLPYENQPGVLSMEFLRPPEGHQFFAGPLDDVAPGEDTFVSIQNESAFCASCHYGVFWNTPIYNSYGEWLDSDYSDAENGQTCQDCHMPQTSATYFALPEQGGIARDPQTIFSHQMTGASDPELLQNAVTMQSEVRQQGDRIIVDIKIVNDKTGHSVPSDSPLRQMILIVQVVDENGQRLSLTEGPVLPDWTGVGEAEDGYYAGLPGKGYAKILQEIWTGISPSGAYWNPTRILSDTRLEAMQTDTSRYVFSAIDQAAVTVQIKLIYRRAFIELMDQKSWDVPDIIMEEEIYYLK